jgi:uncharacterized phage-associated protein
MYSALAISNTFIKRALQGKLKKLTPMKLQKLLFFAQSWYLRLNNRPLFDDLFARWQYGPVIPSIYREFKRFGPKEIADYGKRVVVDEDGEDRISIPGIDEERDKETISFIEEITNVYGDFTGWELSVMTHEKGSAWQISGGADGGPIPLDIMKKHIHPEQDQENE